MQAPERADAQHGEADLGRCARGPSTSPGRIEQRDIAAALKISRPLCSAIVPGHIWNPEVKLTTGDEMRDRIIGALDTGCRRGEMLKIQNKQVDWRHRWIRILKEHSKTD